MKIILSPSKEMNIENLENKKNTINSKFFTKKLKEIKSISNEETKKEFKAEIYEMNQKINKQSKPAILLYKGLSFRQLNQPNIAFYNNLIILSSLYGYSYASDYISPYRLDYTTRIGRMYKQEMYDEFNEHIKNEDVIYNLASKEFSANVEHTNIINFDFLVIRDGAYKNVSALSKKLRGAMCEYILSGGELKKFDLFEFYYDHELSTKDTFVYVKTEIN